MKIIEKIKAKNFNETTIFNVVVVVIVIVLGILFHFYDKKQNALFDSYMEATEKELSADNILGVITNLNEAIKIKPSDYKVYSIRAFAYYALEENEKALADTEKIISLKGENLESIYKLRGDIFKSLSQADQALEAYRMAYSINPNKENVHNYVGTLIYVEEYEKGYEVIKKYFMEGPKDDFWYDPEIWLDMSIVALKTNRCLDAATSAYHSVMQSSEGEFNNDLATAVLSNALNKKGCIDSGENGELDDQEVKDSVAKNETLIFTGETQ
jgi:Tfp pilus assembly protein PilF